MKNLKSARIARLGSKLKSVRDFATDKSGQAALAFALSAIPLIGVSGVAIDYARMNSMNTVLSTAADSTAINTTAMVVAGTSSDDARARAASYFASLLPPALQDTSATPVITITNSAGLVTTTVAYQSTIQATVSSVLGFNSLSVSAQATAQGGGSASSSTKTLYSESGGVWGDPQIWGDSGQMMTQLECTNSTWYNLISNSGFEMNASCYVGFTGADLNALVGFQMLPPDMIGEYYLRGTTFLIGSHIVSFDTTLLPNTPANNPTGQWQGFGNTISRWDGSVTIDGQKITPDFSTTTSYLNGAVTGMPLTGANLLSADPHCTAANSNFDANAIDWNDPNAFNIYMALWSQVDNICYSMQSDDSSFFVNQNAPYFYTIRSGAYTIEVYYRFDGGKLNIWANNAGACGVPGGIWGKTLVGTYDWNGDNYAIPDGTYKANEFYWSNCGNTTTASNTSVHLVQ